MFGKRPTDSPAQPAQPAPVAEAEPAAIATRPNRIDPMQTQSIGPAQQKAGQPVSGPKPTLAFEQLRAAQGPTQVVREQSDYYHATKTTIFNALINTIDLAQLAQLDT